MFGLPKPQREVLTARTGVEVVGLDPKHRLVTTITGPLSLDPPQFAPRFEGPHAPVLAEAGRSSATPVPPDHMVGLSSGGVPMVLYAALPGETNDAGRPVVARTAAGAPIVAARPADVANLTPSLAAAVIGVDMRGEPVIRAMAGGGHTRVGQEKSAAGLQISGVDASGRAVCAVDPLHPDLLPPGSVVAPNGQVMLNGR